MNEFYKIAKEGLESMNNSFKPLREQAKDIADIITEIIENNYKRGKENE